MTTSAACGRPVQQAGLTETRVVVPLLAQHDEADVGELADVVGAVDWLMPSCSASSPTVTARPAAATACSSRTRVGSARQANHSA